MSSNRRGALGTLAVVAVCVAVCLVVTFTMKPRGDVTVPVLPSPSPPPPANNVTRACSVFCSGPVLQTVQLWQPPLFNDSKTFVDMPLLEDPEVVTAAFLAAGLDAPGVSTQVSRCTNGPHTRTVEEGAQLPLPQVGVACFVLLIVWS